MNLAKFTLLVAIIVTWILFFNSHFNDGICDKFVGHLAQIPQGACLDWSSFSEEGWDYLFFVDSNIYPDEISAAIGLPYAYPMHDDPDKVIIVVKDNQIVSRICGRCSRLLFSPMLKENGVVKITKNDCFLHKRNSGEVWFITPTQTK